MCLWRTLVDEVSADAKVTDATQKLKQARMEETEKLNNAFGSGDKGLLQECVAFWIANASDIKLVRRLEDTTSNAAAVVEKCAKDKKDLMERFGENAMKHMRKMISGHTDSMMQWSWGSWVRAMEETRSERLVEKEKARQKEAAAESRRRMAENALKGTDTAVTQACFRAWADGCADGAETKRRKELAMTKGLQGITKGDQAVLNLHFDSWGQVMIKERGARTIRNAEEEARLANLAVRAAKLDSAKFAFNGMDKALTKTAFGSWIGVLATMKKRERMKAGILKGIGGEMDMIRGVIFQGWQKMTSDDLELARNRGRRRRLAEMGRAIILRLRALLHLRSIFNSWVMRCC